jgi:hypothetical protein
MSELKRLETQLVDAGLMPGGVKGNAYLIKIGKKEQLEYIKFLVKQKYDSL